MKEERNDEYLEKVNPGRRRFLKTMLKASYVVPTVITVSMVDQQLNLSTAHAQSSNISPAPAAF